MTLPVPVTFDPTRHAYTVSGVSAPSVTEVLSALGIMSLDPNIPTARLEYARQRGAAAHLAIQFACEGRLDPQSLAEEVEPFLFAFEVFCAEHMGDFKPLVVEQPMGDPMLRLAGTPDVIGEKRGTLGVLDVKTGADMPDGTKVQTALYKVIAKANGFAVIERMGLHLKPDGTFTLYPYRDPMDEAEGRAACLIYHRRYERKKGRLQ